MEGLKSDIDKLSVLKMAGHISFITDGTGATASTNQEIGEQDLILG